MLTDERIELLIEEIEKRPAIYDTQLREYSNTVLKKALWEEICSAVVPDWSVISSENKTKAGYDIQKKWQNLRTCFSRELRLQKQASGQSSTKRRQYIYFEKLLFLIPTMESRFTDTNETLFNDDEEESSQINENVQKTPRKEKIKTKMNLEETLLNIQSKNQDDGDMHFALSLVPSLKRLDQTNKLEAKIQILSIIKNITANSLSNIYENTEYLDETAVEKSIAEKKYHKIPFSSTYLP